MVSVYIISNLKIVYNSDTNSFIAFDNKEKNEDDENEDVVKTEQPIFSAESLTTQEKYLLGKLLCIYSNNEFCNGRFDVVKALERKNSDLFNVIEELNQQLIECKNEYAALEVEINDLRRSKLEFERIKKEGEGP